LLCNLLLLVNNHLHQSNSIIYILFFLICSLLFSAVCFQY
jgi:hypothetical protein